MAGSKNVKVSKEAFYVRVESSDGTVAFYNATDHVGKTMPFSKPKATCAMRVANEAVSFSLLHLTNKNSALVAAKPVTIPRGPLSRLERRAAGHGPLSTDEVIVEISSRAPGERGEDEMLEIFAEPSGLGDVFAEGDNSKKKRPMKPAIIETFKCKLSRDENSVARLEAADEEHIFELPKGALHVSLYLQSPVAAVNRPLAIGFIGHVGKPGSAETVTRVAAMVLNSISHLPDFRILGQIEHCVVPANPARGGGVKRPVNKGAQDRVVFKVNTFLFDEQLTPVGQGIVTCEIDLENANPTSGKLLVNYQCEEKLAPVFERYRAELDRAIAGHLRTALGEDTISSITYDVVLGSVTLGTVHSIKEAVKNVPAWDLSPTQSREHAG
jgi:hypothetical protein